MLDTNAKSVIAVLVGNMRHKILVHEDQIWSIIDWRPAEGLVDWNAAVGRDITFIVSQHPHLHGVDRGQQSSIQDQIDALPKVTINFSKLQPWTIYSVAN